MKLATLLAALSLVLGAVGAPMARAQDVLPKPEPPFKGTIGQTVKESKADYPKPLEAPAGAPNVALGQMKVYIFGKPYLQIFHTLINS